MEASRDAVPAMGEFLEVIDDAGDGEVDYGNFKLIDDVAVPHSPPPRAAMDPPLQGMPTAATHEAVPPIAHHFGGHSFEVFKDEGDSPVRTLPLLDLSKVVMPDFPVLAFATDPLRPTALLRPACVIVVPVGFVLIGDTLGTSAYGVLQPDSEHTEDIYYQGENSSVYEDSGGSIRTKEVLAKMPCHDLQVKLAAVAAKIGSQEATELRNQACVILDRLHQIKKSEL